LKGTSGVFVCYDDIEGKKVQSAVDKFYVLYLHIIVCGHGYMDKFTIFAKTHDGYVINSASDRNRGNFLPPF